MSERKKIHWYMEKRWFIAISVIASFLVILLLPIIGSNIISEGDFEISVNPTAGDITVGNSIQAAITSKSIEGYDSTVSLAAVGQPSGVVVTIDPQSDIKLDSLSMMNVEINSSLPSGNYTIKIIGRSLDGKEDDCEYNLTYKRS